MFLRIGSGILGGLRRTMEAVVIVVFIMMISLVLIQVGGRYIFNYSISGTEEVALYAQIWMVMIGAGVAMRFGRHVAVDVLVTKLPIPMARVLNILITLGCLWFLYILFVGALPLIEVGFFERSPAMRIPMWTMYQSLTIGAVYFALEVVMWVARRWDDPYGKNETRE